MADAGLVDVGLESTIHFFLKAFIEGAFTTVSSDLFHVSITLAITEEVLSRAGFTQLFLQLEVMSSCNTLIT